MSTEKLTARQRRMYRALSGEYEPARDIAERASVDVKAAGAVLASLHGRGLVEARYEGLGRLYVWRRAS